MSGQTDGLDSLIYEKILASMRDGVVTVDLGGRIMTFNEAAGRILGLSPSETIGETFAEVFLIEERFEDFNEVVLKAVYDNETTHSREVAVEVGGRRTDLAVTSTFLMLDRDGEPERRGVIVVFSDVTEERKRRKIKRLFGEYVDPRIVERILGRGVADDQRGRRETMTISFADLRDFTSWSERLDPELLVAFINRFLTLMTGAIGDAGGLTDKYIGDAVMACWGPPFSDPDTQAIDACTAALCQVEGLPALRATLAEMGIPRAAEADVAIGVGTGEVISGDIGSEQSRNFTVIGNAVNVAARLQDAAKRYGQRILVSDETRRRAGPAFVFREIDRIALRGRTTVEPIHALLGRAGAVEGAQLDLAEAHEAGLTALFAGDANRAAERFRACLGADPSDRAAALLLDRCDGAGRPRGGRAITGRVAGRQAR